MRECRVGPVQLIDIIDERTDLTPEKSLGSMFLGVKWILMQSAIQ
jgi:hypothetical protein